MAEISKITLPSGSTYDLKDTYARTQIEAIEAAISGGVTFVGETTTVLTDGATTNPITINNASVNAIKGYLVVYNSKEFVFDGTEWIELGDLSLIGDLGWKDTASGSYTPTGSVSQPTFSGNTLTSTGKLTATGSITITKAASGEANYTPQGTVSQPSFVGNVLTSVGNFTPAGNITISTGDGATNYEPEGSVSAPTISVLTAGSTATVNSITNVGTLPSLSATVTNETLTIGFDQGTLPTKGADVTVKTSDAAYSASAPSFSGTGVQLTASFSGTQGAVSVSGTPEGTVSQPSFTGTGARLEGSFSGNELNVEVTGTPSGTISQPTFSGTEATITVS